MHAHHYGLSVITPPAVEPVTRAEAKLWAKVDLADDDLIIDSNIIGAREYAERFCRRAFITQTLLMTLDAFGPDPLESERFFAFAPPLSMVLRLCRAPVQSLVTDQQTITMGAVSAGTFTLTMLGQTTVAIQWNATAAAVQAALNALSPSGSAAVTCTGGPLPTTGVVVNFTGFAVQGNQPVMTHTDTLTGGVATVTHTTVGSLISIQYIDPAGNLQTLDPTLYTVDTISEPTRITPIWGRVWPVTRPFQPNAVQITFSAGFGAAGANVPEGIKRGIKTHVADAYYNRESPRSLENVDNILYPYRMLEAG